MLIKGIASTQLSSDRAAPTFEGQQVPRPPKVVHSTSTGFLTVYPRGSGYARRQTVLRSVISILYMYLGVIWVNDSINSIRIDLSFNMVEISRLKNTR